MDKRIDTAGYIETLKNFANEDTEMGHVHADDLLCELLVLLGYADVVEQYNKIHKWYA